MNYRVTFVPKFGCTVVFEQEFLTDIAAVAALDAVANYTLFLHEQGYMVDHSNAGFIDIKDSNGDWVEWSAEDRKATAKAADVVNCFPILRDCSAGVHPVQKESEYEVLDGPRTEQQLHDLLNNPRGKPNE